MTWVILRTGSLHWIKRWANWGGESTEYWENQDEGDWVTSISGVAIDDEWWMIDDGLSMVGLAVMRLWVMAKVKGVWCWRNWNWIHVGISIHARQWVKTTISSKTIEPMYSHRSRHREQPSQLCSDNHTLLGYWEINGVKAQCLLDSRGKGVLLSLEFMWATGTKTFAPEQPIALQLACISSQSMINYRTHVTIKIGHMVVDEYFNVLNVEHYNVILGTPFLRKNEDNPGL